MPDKPAHEIRFGVVKVLIWANQTSKGVMHNVTACRLFKDGDEWKESSSFGRDDLLLLAKTLDQAHSWIYEQKQSA